MTPEITPLKPSPNWEILNAVREDASSAYQDRIPEATKASLQDTVQKLLDYPVLFNEFSDALVNQIGLILIRNTVWSNPLAEFKQPLLTYGATIEEVKVGLLRAHNYDPDREYLEEAIFGTERPEIQSNFHTINRQNYYKITVNELLLKRAFLEPMGLSSFISSLMNAPATSDAWDEFLMTCNLFQKYESNGGFYKIQVPDVAALESGAADAKAALRRMRALAGNLKFMSTKYNAAKMPTFANFDDLVIFTTPEFNAALDVEALAAAFNLDSAIARGRIIEIPADQFGIAGAQAVVTTKDFFVIADTLFETRSADNPVALHRNYFLHHHSIISVSRFVPAILFTTAPGTEDEVVVTPVSGITAITVQDREGDTVTDVQRGELYQLDAQATTTPAGGVNDGVRWDVAGNTSPRTRITQSGILHVSGTEGSNAITVTATTTWLNDANLSQDGYSTTRNLTVSGDAAPEWNGRLDGTDEPEGPAA